MEVGPLIYQLFLPLNFGFFSIVFFAIYFAYRKLTYIGWFGLAYLAAFFASIFEVFHASLYFGPLYFDDFSNILYCLVSLAFVFAFAEKYGEAKPKAALVLLFLAVLAVQISFGHIWRDLFYRTIAIDALAGTIIALSIPIISKNRQKLIDNVLFWLMIGVTAMILIRPVAGLLVFGANYSEENYASSPYVLLLYFTSAVLALAAALPLLVSAALEIMDQYRQESLHDPLTGLLNRRGLARRFDDWHQIEQDGYKQFVVQFDLDHFKEINDRYGHNVGDIVLERTAKITQSIIADFGSISRIGGEEFVILLGRQEEKSALLLVDHLRLALAMTIHPELDKGHQATASFGLTQILANDSMKSALYRADKALYTAKNLGRNRIETDIVQQVEAKAA